MTKTLLGYGYTNAQGVATLDYDPNDDPIEPSGYHGTGAGHIGITAETAIDGSTLQETCGVCDCSFYDIGTNPSYPSSNWYGRSYLQVSIDDTGTLLSNNGSGNANHLANDSSTSGSSWADMEDWANCKCEFEIVSYTGTVKYFNGASSTVTITGTGTVTLTNNSATKWRLGFQLGAGAKLKYKNFKIYPI